MWDTLLQRLNKTSIDLQKTSFNLNKVTKLYKSLIEFTQNVRDNFDVYEKLAKDMCTDEQDYEVSRKKVPPRSKDLHASSPSSSEIQMTPRETYKINVYFAICDSLIAHLNIRMKPYKCVIKKFACLTKTKSFTIPVLRNKATHLLKCYPSDLDDSFADELIQFSSLTEVDDKIINMF